MDAADCRCLGKAGSMICYEWARSPQSISGSSSCRVGVGEIGWSMALTGDLSRFAVLVSPPSNRS